MDRNDVIRDIRATLLSCKGSLTLQQCDRDFKQLQGGPIPYKRLGYNSLEQLFESVPGFSVRRGPGGEMLVDAISSSSVAAITNLISKQKTNNKKPITRYMPMPRRMKMESSYYNSYNAGPKLQSSYFKPYPKNNNLPPRLYSKPSKENVVPQNYNTNVTKPSAVSPAAKQNGKNNVSTPVKVEKDTKSSMTAFENYSMIMQKRRMNSAASRMERLQLERDAEVNEEKKKAQEILGIVPDSTLKENKTNLLKFCELSSFPEPIFITGEDKSKKGPALFNCTVKIKIGTEQRTFATYPNSLATQELAIETAACKALQFLHTFAKEKQDKKSSSPDVALDRIIKIVINHPNGLIDSTLPSQYQAEYKENLPESWKEIIKSSSFIKMEDAADRRSMLLYYVEHEPPSPKPSLSTSSSTSSMSVEDLNMPPALQYPEDSQWNVFIMSANSTIEVWIRIIGDLYSGAFETLSVDMELYFTDDHRPSTRIVKGGWYALKFDGEWLRTRVLDVNIDSQTVHCFLIDTGDEECHPFTSLYDLPTQFLSLAPQAILCRLSGLESFSMAGISTQLYLADMLVGKSLIAEVIQVPEAMAPDDPSITIILYDTTTDQDLNLNKSMLQLLSQEAKSPTLSLGKITPVNICYVNADGTINIQIQNESWSLLQNMMDQVVNGPFPKETLASSGPLIPDSNTFYLVKSQAGHWRRAILTKQSSGDQISAKFIDYGISEMVSTKDVVLLKRLSESLNSFPIQMLKVSLHNVPTLTNDQVEYLRKLLPPNSTVVCKLVSSASNSVDIYMRTQPLNILCSVSNALNMEIELSKTVKSSPKNDPVASLIKKKERIFSSPSNDVTKIPKFKIPEKDSYFNIFVSMAASPSNFIVQSLHGQNELQELMTNLQSVATLPSLTTMPIVGAAYAAFHEKDQYWYRVCVQGVVLEMASIYFCDYGDVQMVEKSKLKELPSEFKKLPAQAIKAKLYGVAPIDKDWSVEDCFRFQHIVVEKSFVSIVKEIEQDPIQPNEPLLTLNMIDKSANGNVYINDLLAKEGRAKLR